MKTNPSCLTVLLWLCAALIIAIFMIRLPFPLVNHSVPVHLGQGNVVNFQLNTTNEVTTNINAGTTNEIIGFFKTIVDEKSGQYAIVSQDKQVVSLRDKGGNVIWATKITSKLTRQTDGERKIYSMKIVDGNLALQAGRADVVLDKKTGEVILFDIYRNYPLYIRIGFFVY